MWLKKSVTHKNISRRKRADKKYKNFLVTISVLMLSTVIWIFISDYNNIKGSLFSEWIEYKTTTGKIVGSKTFPARRKRLGYEIKYRYAVNSQEYLSNQINFSSIIFHNHEKARSMVRKYKTGSPVTVYYDADSPHFSVLEPQVINPEESILKLTLLIFIVGIFAWLNYVIFLPKQKVATPRKSKKRRKPKRKQRQR